MENNYAPANKSCATSTIARLVYVYRLVEFHDLEPRLTAALAARCHLAAADRDGGAAAVP